MKAKVMILFRKDLAKLRAAFYFGVNLLIFPSENIDLSDVNKNFE
ncbi:hypothetical protein RQN30_11410 [Arcanobacterium hippocoleae]